MRPFKLNCSFAKVTVLVCILTTIRIELMLFDILAAAMSGYQNAWLLEMSVHTLYYSYLFSYSFERATVFLDQICLFLCLFLCFFLEETATCL